MTDIDQLLDPDVRREQNKKYATKKAEKGFYSIGLSYQNGIVIVSHNPSVQDECWKIHEVHNNTAIVGAGLTSDIEEITEKAILEADITELSFSAKDVVTKNLARKNIARYVRARFQTGEPLCAVTLLAGIEAKNMFYKIIFDGEVKSRENFASIGGKLNEDYTNWIEENCQEQYRPGLALVDAIHFGIDCIVRAYVFEEKEETRKDITKGEVFEKHLGSGDELEVAVLDRTIPDASKFAPLGNRLRNEFAPLQQQELQDLLADYAR